MKVARCFLLLVPALIVISTALFTDPWNYNLSSDAENFYIPAMGAESAPLFLSSRKWLQPFFMKSDNREVKAHESKPVFVLALRAWRSLEILSGFRGDVLFSFRRFLLMTVGLCAAAIILLGLSFGHPWLGALGAGISLLCPWAMIYIYYPAYTQLSITFFLMAFLFLLRGPRRNAAIAGLLCSLALLSNASMAVFIGGAFVSLLLFAEHKDKLSRSIYFVMGLTAIFLFMEALSHTPLVKTWFEGAQVDSTFFVFVRYLHRSVYENLFGQAEVPVYPGLLFTILRFNSFSLLIFLIVAPLAWAWGNRKRDLKIGGATTGVPLCLVTALIGILLIDVRGGVQFGRSYFICLPLLLLGTLMAIQETPWRNSVKIAILTCFIVLFSVENTFRIGDQFASFHQFAKSVAANVPAGKRIAVLHGDIYGRSQLLLKNVQIYDPGLTKRIVEIKSIFELEFPENKDVDVVLTGPQAKTIWRDFETPRADYLVATAPLPSVPGIKTFLPSVTPYWDLYPLLVFEDEVQTFLFMEKHQWNENSYAGTMGGAIRWQVVRE